MDHCMNSYSFGELRPIIINWEPLNMIIWLFIFFIILNEKSHSITYSHPIPYLYAGN